MIARIWHGSTNEALADEYQEYIFATGRTDMKSIPGNLDVFLFRRSEGEITHFLIISLWESYEAIARFAGPDIEKAHYYPDDEKYLIEMEPMVTHYEVADQ
jgi:heme-degrading monooxygenase HmoA